MSSDYFLVLFLTEWKIVALSVKSLNDSVQPVHLLTEIKIKVHMNVSIFMFFI